VERSKAFRNKTMRVHPREDALIDRACAALHGVDRSTFMSEAVLFEASRLGVRFTAEPLKPLRTSWPYIPDREESTGVRFTITLSPVLMEIVSRAAAHVHTSEPLFMIGATLAYIGRLQKCFRGEAEDTPEEAAEIRRKLAAIRLPAQYQYGG